MKFKIFLFAIFLSSVLFISCGGVSSKTIKRMQQMEEGVDSPSTISEYQDAIKKFERRIADIDEAQRQVGIWYKIIGSRYLDEGMYGEALKAYQSAVLYYPNNQNLYYYIGLCAGYMSHAQLDYDALGTASEKRVNYLRLSESAYLRAIQIEPRYVRALYGLAVVYVYELDESEKAIPYLETLLTIDKGHTDAMFVLARAYYTNYEFDKAVDIYDKIIATTKDPQKKSDAEANKQTVLSVSYAQ